MSYIPNAINKVTTEVYHTKMSFSGNTSVNDYLTIETPLFSNITLTQNSDNLVLNPGYYAISAAVGVNNTNSVSNNIDARLEIDGSLVGNTASSAQLNKVGIDAAHASLKVANGATSTIKIKVTTQNGTTSINTDYSSLIIKRVAL